MIKEIKIMKIVKSMIKETQTIVKADEVFDRFLSLYQGKIVQVSGPYISLVEGRSSLPDYIVSGSIIIEEGEKLNG
jgi:hypothetical protein